MTTSQATDSSQSSLLARGQHRRHVLELAGASGIGRFTDQQYIDRIKAKVTITESGCWVCAGFQHKMRNVKTHSLGYVSVSYRGTVQGVHRLMYRLLVGLVPNDMQVCHKCDNPPCCNPDHLFLGDQNANMRDMADKKRDKAGITHCVRGHELAGENIYVRPTKTGTRRQCKLCDLIHHRKPERLAYVRAYQKRRRAEKRAARQAVSP
jgi:hypothetical protein